MSCGGERFDEKVQDWFERSSAAVQPLGPHLMWAPSMNTQAGLATCRAASQHGVAGPCACHRAMRQVASTSCPLTRADTSTMGKQAAPGMSRSSGGRPCSLMKLRAGMLQASGLTSSTAIVSLFRCSCSHAPKAHKPAIVLNIRNAAMPRARQAANNIQIAVQEKRLFSTHGMSSSATHHRQPSHACQPNQCILQRRELNKLHHLQQQLALS